MINAYKDSFQYPGVVRGAWRAARQLVSFPEDRERHFAVGETVARDGCPSMEECLVLETLNSERFRDMAPGEIFATLLDEDIYLCSERTMYRILSRHGQNRIRRQSEPREYAKPELLATRLQ